MHQSLLTNQSGTIGGLFLVDFVWRSNTIGMVDNVVCGCIRQRRRDDVSSINYKTMLPLFDDLVVVLIY